MNKFFRILLILTFITSCSLDNKTGIWSPKEKVKKETKKEKKLNTKKITITEEIAIKNTSDSFQQKNYELKIKKDLSRSIARQFVEKLTSYK